MNSQNFYRFAWKVSKQSVVMKFETVTQLNKNHLSPTKKVLHFDQFELKMLFKNYHMCVCQLGKSVSKSMKTLKGLKSPK